MACCLCCCGGVNCEPEQEGKCCCGDTCCQEGEYCIDGVCESTVTYFCDLTTGCLGGQVPGPNPPPGYTGYDTLEECEANCEYLGVICELFSGCGGPRYGSPGSPSVGPATCQECVPSYVCGGINQCGFAGYRDINTIAPPFYASQAACLAVCIAYCDPENGCAFVSTGVSPADAGCESCVPCDECSPLP